MVFETLIQECKLRNYPNQTIKEDLYYNKKYLHLITTDLEQIQSPLDKI